MFGLPLILSPIHVSFSIFQTFLRCKQFSSGTLVHPRATFCPPPAPGFIVFDTLVKELKFKYTSHVEHDRLLCFLIHASFFSWHTVQYPFPRFFIVSDAGSFVCKNAWNYINRQEAMFTVLDKENEACLCRESGSPVIIDEGKRGPQDQSRVELLACRLARAHAERKRIEALSCR